MLGDAMARAAGWTKPMADKLPTIIVRKELLRTMDNRSDAAWSLGVMNLTKLEADQLEGYVSRLQRERTMTATERAVLNADPWQEVRQAREEMMAQIRDGTTVPPVLQAPPPPKWISGVYDAPLPEEEKKPEPGNRFSGLDIE